jgi:hypothetical protein
MTPTPHTVADHESPTTVAAPACLSLGGRGSNHLHLLEADLDAMNRCHAFLMHQGHPTSAHHLEPLLRAARLQIMAVQLGVQ